VGESTLSCREVRFDARTVSASQSLEQAVAGESVGAAEEIGRPVPAGHVLDEAGGVGCGTPRPRSQQRVHIRLARSSIVWLMPRSVSVPEKTLEHWSSQYLTYRYQSWAALWWPARGEDIDVRWLPARPGKAVQLELKTTTVIRPGLHDVMVDLGQLWEYCQRPLGRQPFYAFPRPDSDWDGNLTAAAIAEGRAVTELGFSRSGPGWWFADWMVVLTAAQVADVLLICPELSGQRICG
jgi:hypothetical protein